MIRGAVRNFWRCEQHKLVKRTISCNRNDFAQQAQQLNDTSDIIIRSPFPEVEVPTCLVDEFVWKDLNKWSKKTAIVDGITDRKYSYAQLRDKCRVLAIRLQKNFGLEIGDTIAVCLPNCIDFPIVALGGIEAGMIVTSLNPIYTADEISKQLADSGAKVLFGVGKMSPILEKAVKLSKLPIKMVYLKSGADEALPAGSVNYFDLIDPQGINYNELKAHARDCHDVAFLPYSSGTTGKSKGVLLTHRNINSNNVMIAPNHVCQETTDTWQDVLPCVLPFFHIYGFTVTLISKLALGVKIVSLPTFTPESFLNAMEKYKGTVLHLVPPIVLFLGHYDKIETKHTESIRLIMSGAAPMGKSDVDRLFSRIPNTKFFQAYGLTEASPAVLMNFADNKNFASVGQPCPNTEVKIVALDDPNYRGLGPNQTGELLVRGPQIMKGYHNNPTATKETLTEDGFLRTGDIAYYDEHHEFYITDRLKELIKVKGFQVAPAELEELIRDHPAVGDAAVIGIPHPTFGEVPRAFVVKKADKEVTEQEIQKFVGMKVASYKRLDGGVMFLDSIPKNNTGKIMRRALKEKYC